MPETLNRFQEAWNNLPFVKFAVHLISLLAKPDAPKITLQTGSKQYPGLRRYNR